MFPNSHGCSVLLLVVVLAANGQILQQSPGPNGLPLADQTTKKHYSISGTVVNSVTGEPVRRALVRAAGPEQHAALTGSDGRFQIEGVPEGPVYFSAEKPGYFNESSLPNGRVARQRPVTVSTATQDLQLKLMPEAKIRGRVIDSDGQPIEHLQVEVITEEIVNGRKRRQQRGGSTTNANGFYHVDNLMPGQYIVRTGIQSVFTQFFSMVADAQNVPDEVFPRTYFPNAMDASSAQALDLKAGQEEQADFRLTPVRAFKMSGVITNFQDGVFPICENADGEQIGTGVRIDQKTGMFVISQIPAGSYTLAFRRQDQQNTIYYAEEAITIGTSDVEGLRFSLQPLFSIPVSFPGAAEGTTPQVQVELIPKEKGQSFQFYSDQRTGSSTGPLIIPSVLPGTYSVAAHSFGTACIQSVSSGNLDLLREDLTVPAGSQPAPIEVSVRDDCATLSGTVQIDGESSGGMAVLVPDESSVEPKLALIQPNGGFSFVGLSPGNYKIYAFSDIAGLEYADPEQMKGFESQEISLDPNQKAHVDLKLNVRGSK